MLGITFLLKADTIFLALMAAKILLCQTGNIGMAQEIVAYSRTKRLEKMLACS
jgi:hypothetical protein